MPFLPSCSPRTSRAPSTPHRSSQRDQWISLNGPWEFEFDDAHAGLAGGWAAGTRKFSRTITVPFAVESKISGIGDTSFHPDGLVPQVVRVPDTWKGRRVLLHFGAVDYRSRVWVNGPRPAHIEGGNVPSRFDITAYLKPGAELGDRVGRGSSYRPLHSSRQAILGAEIPIDFLHPHLRHLAARVAEATGESYLEKVRITPLLMAPCVSKRWSPLRPGTDIHRHGRRRRRLRQRARDRPRIPTAARRE